MSGNERPRVSVVVPFKGGNTQARALLDALESIDLSDGDELLVVDNTREGAAVAIAGGRRVRVVHAPEESSSYYARNVGVEHAEGEWILFTDADCRPRSSIIRDYFANTIHGRCGALGGEVVGAAEQTSFVARYAVARRHLNQAEQATAPKRAFAGTANVLVRRDAWIDVGGFCEGIRTGGDQDFSWRLRENGWTVEYARDAVVEHLHRERVVDLFEQWHRYGVAIAWLARRHPDSYEIASTTRSLGGAGRVLVRAAAKAARGAFEDGLFTTLDAVVAVASAFGPLSGNRARRNTPRPAPRAVALIDAFPGENAGEITAIQIEARRRSDRPRPWLIRDRLTHYAEDDGGFAHARDLTWLICRHPVRAGAEVLRDRRQLAALHALAPVTRRIGRAVKRGATWQSDSDRWDEAELIGRVLGSRPVSIESPIVSAAQQRPKRSSSSTVDRPHR